MTDKPITLTDLHKLRRDDSKIAMLTGYDASFAALLENAGVESDPGGRFPWQCGAGTRHHTAGQPGRHGLPHKLRRARRANARS